MEYQKLLCQSIKKLRSDSKLTQDKFAEKIGITTDTVRNIEHNKYTPTAKTIDKICTTFNITPADLLIPQPTADNNSYISIITQKIRNCDLNQLDKINLMIDIIRK